jgi:hypothetical protein
MALGADAQASPHAKTSERPSGQYELWFPSAQQGAEELYVKPGVWIDGDLRGRLTR